MILLTTVVSLMLAAPAVAFAQQDPTCSGSQPLPQGWSVDPPSGPPGTQVTITGDQAYPDVDIYVYYRETGQLLFSAVQQDAYGQAAATTRSSMPGTGLFLLVPAAGVALAGIGFTVTRKHG